MRVVLLGAGASYGSGDVDPAPPPLGAELYPALEEIGGIFSDLPEDLKAEFRKDFEEGMGKYYEISGGNVSRFQRELAAYFAKFKIGKNNEYIKMLAKLGSSRYVYATLNYDLLLESAASALGMRAYYGLERNAKTVNLLKPHGSCNFWPDMFGMFKNCTFAGGGLSDIEAPIKVLNTEETLHACATEDSIAPALAMYAKGKAVRVCPEFVLTQQKLFAKAVNDATVIYISGVRVVAGDTHIWQPISKSKAKVIYFGSNRSIAEFQAWVDSEKRGKAFFREAYFSECIDKIASLA
ncbi:hypothetical protein ACVCIC_06190 [Burkholderia glumae]